MAKKRTKPLSCIIEDGFTNFLRAAKIGDLIYNPLQKN